jgi:hypothetical protein
MMIVQVIAGNPPGDQGPSRDGRLKLTIVERERVGEFLCRARVVLEGPRAERYEGHAELPLNDQNLLRVAAQAALLALGQLPGESLELRLVGLRSLRIFDTAVVAVQVASRRGGREALLFGVALASEDSALGAARAVLHATNRLIGNLVERYDCLGG